MMQEQSYGLDYAIYRHDIERIEEYSDFREVNNHMKNDGWVLLAIIQFADTDTFYKSGEPIYNASAIYVMGIPRPQYCKEWGGEHPKQALKQWDHVRKEWECRWCTEHDAHKKNAQIDNPDPPF